MANACLKSSFCGVSVLCAVISLALAGGGIWYSLKLKEVTDLRNFESYQLDFNVHWPQVMPYVFVGVGTLGLLIACCGFCGSAGSKACLITYNVCAVIVIIAMIGAGISAIMIATQKSDDFFKRSLLNIFREVAAKRRDVSEKFSAIESSLHCCGADGPQNYVTLGLDYPQSCCDVGRDCSQSLNPRLGCIKVISTYTKWAFYVGTAGCGVVAILGIVSMFLSIALIRRMNSKVII